MRASGWLFLVIGLTRRCARFGGDVAARFDIGLARPQGRHDRGLPPVHDARQGDGRVLGPRHRSCAFSRRGPRRKGRLRAHDVAEPRPGSGGRLLRHRHGRSLGHARPTEDRLLLRSISARRKSGDRPLRRPGPLSNPRRHRSAGGPRHHQSRRRQRAVRPRPPPCGRHRRLPGQSDDLRPSGGRRRRRDDHRRVRDALSAKAASRRAVRHPSGQAIRFRRESLLDGRPTPPSRPSSINGCTWRWRTASSTRLYSKWLR